MRFMSLGLAVNTVACELLSGPPRTLEISKTDTCKPTWERALAWEGIRSHDGKCRSLPSQQNLPLEGRRWPGLQSSEFHICTMAYGLCAGACTHTYPRMHTLNTHTQNKHINQCNSLKKSVPWAVKYLLWFRCDWLQLHKITSTALLWPSQSPWDLAPRRLIKLLNDVNRTSAKESHCSIVDYCLQ